MSASGDSGAGAAVPGPATNGAGTFGERLLGVEVGGRYRLDEVLGRGSSATVYRARDDVLGRPVAVKLLNPARAREPGRLERFRREARAMARLAHPNIVSVIDSGDADLPAAADGGAAVERAPFMVLELVGGETLGRRIRREGALDPQDALRYATEIGRGLEAAHAHGIVHRDVKPQNIFLGGEGGAKIGDFGIARTLSEEGLTLGGRVLATTDYVSPEQALGEPVTGASDVYSLGVVLFEMLTGHVPFKAKTPVAVAMRHVREELPDVQQSRPEISAATAAVVERATAKDPAHRYPSAGAMVEELEEVRAIEARRARPPAGDLRGALRDVARRGVQLVARRRT
ncbi:MAG: serine/threonine protein kinase [Acidobacteriota bacterium]|nr:serine/threonine protein kinase [Acidobacteriota bacterium]